MKGKVKMKVYFILRPYLYADEVVAVVKSQHTAKIIAEKWGCKVVEETVPDNYFRPNNP